MPCLPEGTLDIEPAHLGGPISGRKDLVRLAMDEMREADLMSRDPGDHEGVTRIGETRSECLLGEELPDLPGATAGRMPSVA